MAIRNIYLKIEHILGYSPVAPQDEMGHYHHDCARNPGHEDGRVPDGEAGRDSSADCGRRRGEASEFRFTVEESECSSPTRPFPAARC